MLSNTTALPPLPEIGHPESYYAKYCRHAERIGNHHTHEAYKVAQYITLGLDPHLAWEDKLRYFQHALKRHCVSPNIPNHDVKMFYDSLADLVRTYAGQEALRLASAEDDRYARSLSRGVSRELIRDGAEVFFHRILPTIACPPWYHDGDFHMLKMIRDQWI